MSLPINRLATAYALCGSLLLGLLGAASIVQAETHITTYVTKVQEERRDTRWTLTEWLKIKERMRLMDLWLAMFSDPRKDRFRPELYLSYGMMSGARSWRLGDQAAESLSISGSQGRAQLWLTNLVSGSLGLRTLNLDLGAELYHRSMGAEIAREAQNAAPSPAALASVGSSALTYYTGNLRLFGKHIQDSSLVLKYGEYQARGLVPDADLSPRITGKVAGAELQLYLLKSLGLEGSYLAFGNRRGASGTASLRGRYAEALAFVEVSLLRLMIGRYQEEWSFSADGQERESREHGLTFGGRLSL